MNRILTTQIPLFISFWEWYYQRGDWLHNFIKFIAFLAAGFILGRILRIPISRWIEKATPETDHTTSVQVGRGIERSVFLLVFTLVLKAGAIDVLHLPGWMWEKLGYGLTILLAIASTMLCLQIMEIILLGVRQRWQQAQGGVDDHLINFLRKGIRIFIILLAVIITLQNLKVEVTGAIAGLGIGGAALALGAQGLIANLLGTIEIVADRLYRVGDRIHFENFDGFVTDVGLRSTKIRALTGEQITTPNKKMAEVQIRNFSRNGFVRTSVTVGITYSTTHNQIHRAMEILEQILKMRADVQSHQIFLKNLAAYSLDLEVIFWARYALSSEYNELMGQVQMEIKRQFDEAKIEFAFPTQTLLVNPPSQVS